MRIRAFAAALAGVMMFAGIGMTDPTGIKAEERAAKEMPKNPVHHCTKDDAEDTGRNDTTDWSNVYFGSYPQTTSFYH